MIFKRDSAILGLILGVLTPLIVYFFEQKGIPLILGYSFSKPSMQLFALVFNLPIFRYYLIRLGYEKTGKGILFITFIYALFWVYYNQDFI